MSWRAANSKSVGTQVGAVGLDAVGTDSGADLLRVVDSEELVSDVFRCDVEDIALVWRARHEPLVIFDRS